MNTGRYGALLMAFAAMLGASTTAASAETGQSYYARSIIAPGTRTFTGTWTQVGTDGSCDNGVVTTTYQPKCSNTDCGPTPAPKAPTTSACNVMRTCTASASRRISGTPSVTASPVCQLSDAIAFCSRTANAAGCYVLRTNTLYGCDTYTAKVFLGAAGSAAVVPSGSSLDYAGSCQ